MDTRAVQHSSGFPPKPSGSPDPRVQARILEVAAVQRLFVGIEVPGQIRAALQKLRMAYPTARWHPPEALHITLSFIGHVELDRAAQMAAALVHLPHPQLSLRVQGVGCFGGREKPRVLWAGIEPDGALLALQQGVERRLLPLGLVPDARPYCPHVTLARVRQGGEALETFLQAHQDLSLPAFRVSEVCLYVSHGGADGVRYEVIERFSLLKR